VLSSCGTARRSAAVAAVAIAAACGSSPTDPRQAASSLSADITVGIDRGDDYVYNVGVRLHDLGGPGVTVTKADLTLSAPNGTIRKALDELVSKTFRESTQGLTFANDPGLALATTATAGIAYVDQAGNAGNFSVTKSVPACWTFYAASCGVGPLEVGQTSKCGGSVEFGCTPNYLPLSGSSIHWQSKVPGVATVSTAGELTAWSPGIALIVASFKSDGVLSFSFPACVGVACKPDSLKISPPVESIASGSKHTFEAILSWYGQGSTRTYGGQWQSSNPLVGVFRPNDLDSVFTAIAPGTTTVSATYAGVTGSLVVTVK
jgi:hypothetical protein